MEHLLQFRELVVCECSVPNKRTLIDARAELIIPPFLMQ